jgi:hypothetical protein
VIRRPGFLFDEHLGPRWAAALRTLEPGIEVRVVGHGGGPPAGTPDPDLLVWAEERGCFLVTLDRATMPAHLADHLALGRHVPGVLLLPLRLAGWSPVLEDLLLIWLAGRPEEFADRVRFLPL